MTIEQKNGKISSMILARMRAGQPLIEAFDAVLGAGTFTRIAGEVWEAMQPSKPAAPEPVRFEVGVSYFCRSLGDSECIWHFSIIRRTESSVWVEVNGKECRRSIRVWSGVEKFEPFGRYSMSPVVSADRRSMSLAASA